MKFVAKVTGFISKFDIHGAPVQLEVKGDSESKTAFGALVSLTAIIMSLYLSFPTFLNYYNKENPNVVTSINYDLNTSNFNTTSFFFSISFYKPLNASLKSTKITSDINDMDYISHLYPTKILCTTCDNSTDDMKNMYMCTEDTFSKVTIKSFSKLKSDGILSIFKRKAFCLPDNITGILQDELTNEVQDSSLRLQIPFNESAPSDADIPRNTKSSNADYGSSVNKPKVQSTSTPVKVLAPAPAPSPAPNQNQNGDQNQQPGTGTQPTQQPGTGTQPTQQPGTGTQPTQQPATGTQPAQQPGTGTQTTPPPVLLRNLDTIAQEPTDDQLALLTQQIQLISYKYLQTQISELKFPKILFLYKKVEINSHNSSEIGKDVYFLDVLDYKDPFLNKPNVFDVHVQQETLVIQVPGMLGATETSLTYLAVSAITKNDLDSETNVDALLNFKLLSDAKTITVQYIGIADFLNAFGGFYGSFEILASIISGFYSGYFLRSQLVSAVFKFVDNESKYKTKTEFKFKRVPEMRNPHSSYSKDNTDTKNINSYTVNRNSYIENNQKSYLDLNQKSYIDCENKSVLFDKSEENPQFIEIEAKGHSDGIKISEKNDQLPMIILNDIIIDPEFNETPNTPNTPNEVYYNQNSERKKITQHGKSNNDIHNVSPLYKFEAIEMAKIKETNKENFNLFNYYTRKIYETNSIKLKQKKKIKPTFISIVISTFCNCCSKRKWYHRYDLFNKCGDVIDQHLQIDHIIRKCFEVNLIKDFLFADKERMLLDHQIRYINIANKKESEDYLDYIGLKKPKKKLDIKAFEHIKENEQKIEREKLLEGYNQILNY
jgi:hypothetical protein